jgi:hypothetical protein
MGAEMTTTLSSSLENTMKLIRTLPWLAAALVACLLAAPAVNAQTLSAAAPAVASTVASSAAGEALTVKGSIPLSASYIADPAGGPATMVYFVDGTGLTITGSSGKSYSNTCQANLTRPFPATLKDSIVLTCSVFGATGAPRTVQLTFNVTLSSAHTVTALSVVPGNLTGI